MTTTTTDQRLYGPPGAESMGYDPHDAAHGVLDDGWEPAETGDCIVIEEWTVADPASFLPDAAQVADWVARWPDEMCDETTTLECPYLNVWMPPRDIEVRPDIVEAIRPFVESIRSVLLQDVAGVLAKDHVANWVFPVVGVVSWKCPRCRRSFSIPLGAPECQDHRPEKEIEHELGVPTRTEIRTEEAHRRAVSEWMARGV